MLTLKWTDRKSFDRFRAEKYLIYFYFIVQITFNLR